MATQEPKTIAFVLYPGLTPLDLIGPLQVGVFRERPLEGRSPTCGWTPRSNGSANPAGSATRRW